MSSLRPNLSGNLHHASTSPARSHSQVLESGHRCTPRNNGATSMHSTKVSSRKRFCYRGKRNTRKAKQHKVNLQARHHDRSSARLLASQRVSLSSRVILLRYQRFNTGNLLLQPRRCREQILTLLHNIRNTERHSLEVFDSKAMCKLMQLAVADGRKVKRKSRHQWRIQRPPRINTVLPHTRVKLRIVFRSKIASSPLGSCTSQPARQKLNTIGKQTTGK